MSPVRRHRLGVYGAAGQEDWPCPLLRRVALGLPGFVRVASPAGWTDYDLGGLEQMLVNQQPELRGETGQAC